MDYPYLTRKEFDVCVELFVARYRSALEDSGARVEQRTSSTGRQYLVLQRAVYSKQAVSGPVHEEDIEDDDPTSPVFERIAGGAHIEYHTVYSTTWRVPVLYVRVVTSTGEVVLDGERVCDMVTEDSAIRLAMAAVPFGGALGVGDHPELGVPFMYLHPCHTAKLLSAVVAPDQEETGVSVGPDRYLAAWMSLSGAAVGLSLPSIGYY
ncbi:E2-like conjugating enzyme atg10 [Coemansia sp. RSA 2050]|nr:E2-like conjugating enzyme atg10 [Coemansia sp. RSA 2050]KAJ2733277.1 E2-like conjugating enzyme atg10 [Coemansia sp. BCRC 34962]